MVKYGERDYSPAVNSYTYTYLDSNPNPDPDCNPNVNSYTYAESNGSSDRSNEPHGSRVQR